MNIWIIVIGVICLLVNAFFYLKELRLMGTTFKGMFTKQNSPKEFGQSVWMTFQDIFMTGIVVMLAGTGIHAFLIGTMGGAIVSLVLWRKELMGTMSAKLTGENAKCIEGELVPITV